MPMTDSRWENVVTVGAILVSVFLLALVVVLILAWGEGMWF
jgi:hypothetical protein